MPIAIRDITAFVLALSAMYLPNSILAGDSVHQVRPVLSLPHGHDSFRFAFAADGEFFVTWDAVTRSADASIAVWRASDWCLVTRKNLRKGLWVDAKTQSDSSLVVSTQVRHPSGKRRYYRLSLPELEGVGIEREPRSDIMSPDGRIRVSRARTSAGDESPTAIELRTARSNKLVLKFEPYRLHTSVSGFSPDSRYLAFSGTNHRARRYKDVPPPEVLAEQKVEPPFRLWDVVANREFRHAVRGSWRWTILRFTSDSKKVVVRTSEEILVTDFRTGEIVARHGVQGVQWPQVSGDGSLVAFHEDNQAVLWDHAETHHSIWKCHDADGPRTFLFAPGRETLVTKGFDGTLLIWRVEELLLLATPQHGLMRSASE
ncbi:MAG: WD40 repeat domain-containing protein [Planctomycetes bacterium]|nr:WD40 repeat domain-containing protein [Planctomycetota bacterium]